ncbi:dynein heavy chain and region D6 of dynein motor-domain-containing protein [Hyaloraphidium curvatum]|nr:dynein heavy chain and region D6 of dynein motor-domain-containing protein [Hyaloraphidium curvatum]
MSSIANLRTSFQNLRSTASLNPWDADKKKGLGGTSSYSSLLEKRRQTLDSRHRFLLAAFAAVVQEREDVLENQLLHGSRLETMNEFFSEEGPQRLFLLWQPPTKEELVTLKGAFNKNVMLVTASFSSAMLGPGCFFLRMPGTGVTAQNLQTSLSYGSLNSNPVPALTMHLTEVICPSVQAKIRPVPSDAASTTFATNLAAFSSNLTFLGIEEEQFRLAPCTIDLSGLSNPSCHQEVLKNPVLLSDLEKKCTEWHHQAKQVLTQCDQIRKDVGDVGPNAELQHWKFQMVKYSQLVQALSIKEVSLVISILKACGSAKCAPLQHLIDRIGEESKIANENLRYLLAMESNIQCLYQTDPEIVMDYIPGIVEAVKMLMMLSTGTHASERITSLLVKIANQMVRCCHGHVLKQGVDHSFWTLDSDEARGKLQVCLRLRDSFQSTFEEMKLKIQSFIAQPPEISTKHVFGKLDAFCRRLNALLVILDWKEAFQQLKDADPRLPMVCKAFDSALSSVQQLHLDPLNTDDHGFEESHNKLLEAARQAEDQARGLLATTLASCTNTQAGIEVLERFASIPKLNLGIDALAAGLFSHFIANDLEATRRLYQRAKDSPPIPWHMPEASGAIAWAGQLLHSVEEPMKFFASVPALLDHPDNAMKLQHYNILTRALLEYQLLWHDHWVQSVKRVGQALHVPLLARDAQGHVCINLSAEFDNMVLEVTWMDKLGMIVPPDAVFVASKCHRIKPIQSRLQAILARREGLLNEGINGTGMGSVVALLASTVDRHLHPAFSVLTWSSLNLEPFLQTMEHSCHAAELHANHLQGIAARHLLPLSDRIASIALLPMQQQAIVPRTLQQMVEDASHMIEAGTKDIAETCQAIEAHLMSFLQSVQDAMPRERMADGVEVFRVYYEEVASHLGRNLLMCLRNALEQLRTSLGLGGVPDGPNTGDMGKPVFQCQLLFGGQGVLAFEPPLWDFQRCVSDLCSKVIGICGVVQSQKPWADLQRTLQSSLLSEKNHTSQQTESTGEEQSVGSSSVLTTLEQHLEETSSNRELAKLVTLIAESLAHSAKNLEHQLISARRWDSLVSSRNADISTSRPEALLEELSLLSEVKQHIAQSMPLSVSAGAFMLDLSSARSAVLERAQNQLNAIGQKLKHHVRDALQGLTAFIRNKQDAMQHDVSGIEELHYAVSILNEIRDQEIDMEFQLAPIEDIYSSLVKHGIKVTKEESELVDSVQYSLQKLRASASELQGKLHRVQPKFKAELVQAVEHFVKGATDFATSYRNLMSPLQGGAAESDESVWKAHIEVLKTVQLQFNDLDQKSQSYSAALALFALPPLHLPRMAAIKTDLKHLQTAYALFVDITARHNSLTASLDDTDLTSLSKDIESFKDRFEKLPSSIQGWSVFNVLKERVDLFCHAVPLLELLCNKSVKKRHWDRLSTVVPGIREKVAAGEKVELRSLICESLVNQAEDVEDVCNAAVKEADIQSKLESLANMWNSRSFSLAPFKTRGDIILKSSVIVLMMTDMEDSLMLLSSLSSNRYNGPFKDEIAQWVHQLSITSETVEQWVALQNLWIYLEAVFVGGDIAKQLPKEAKRFAGVDKSWCKIMATVAENPNVLACCAASETIRTLIPQLMEQLEICQKSLSGYLESKRSIFPRFYFVSDPTLLEILGQASDSHTIQPHLRNVFDNVFSVQFHDKDYNQIVAMESGEGEKVPLSQPCQAVGNVELWLGKLLEAVQTTVNHIIGEAVMKLSMVPLLEILAAYPAQVGIVILQIFFTALVEDALVSSKGDRKKLTASLQGVTDLLNSLIEITTKELMPMERTKYETFITIQVHHRDVCENLIKSQCKSPGSFDWLKQCRFYWDPTKSCCFAQITNFDFKYGCEYLGCSDRLAITPLTDRCYITLAQALGMSLGGSPAGPAGTGKTETVKDMGKALGKWVVVFNCSDQMDYRGLGRIFKGLAQSGCWGDFDEFNRIELPVLSVAAQQIACVLSARRERKKAFTFTDGETVELNPDFGIFITMNPGYAGRVELPENLKTNFRYVAMMVPDRQIIMRVKLAGSGFLNNIVLARKFSMLYKLCEEQLSKQVHYDFGLRNILSVLRTCGAAKRASPAESEVAILMRVLRDMNVSKLVDQDTEVFLSLLNDLFPGVESKRASHDLLESKIREELVARNLTDHPPWTSKVLQFHESSLVRHGLMILGPPGVGKTTCLQVLIKARMACGEVHREIRMNPKAITDYQMFGKLDVATNDWTDGIFSAIWRRAMKRKGEYTWIVLDGPVDAVWIESLNSVLDDNKCLTLANGDRLSLPQNCKLVFEVHSLKNASPATVSRCGMIYIGLQVLPWGALLQSWLKGRTRDEAKVLEAGINLTFDKTHSYLVQTLHPQMDLTPNAYFDTLSTLLSGLLTGSTSNRDHLERVLVFALSWTFGSMLDNAERIRLQDFLFTSFAEHLPFPTMSDRSSQTLFEYFVDSSGNWEHWGTQLKAPLGNSTLVPTIESLNVTYLLDILVKQNKPVLLTGEMGTAKTTMLHSFVEGLTSEKYVSKQLALSSTTSTSGFQKMIESSLEKKMGNTFGPPNGKRMCIFLDDFSIPDINQWGDQPTLEIMRQLIEYQGFFSLDRPGEWTAIQDLSFVCAMALPGGGKNDIPERLKRHFVVINCPIPAPASLDRICSTLMSRHFSAANGFAEEVVAASSSISKLAQHLWQATKDKMLPTPAKFHYSFNLRDLGQIMKGLLRANSEVVTDPLTLFKLWAHESKRVLCDRFVTIDDANWFDRQLSVTWHACMNEASNEHLPLESLAVENLWCTFQASMTNNEASLPAANDAASGDTEARDEPPSADPVLYRPAKSMEILRARLMDLLEKYNASIRGPGLKLVFFDDAILNICKLTRILSDPGASAMLVGVGGSGKKSLAKLASFISGNQLFQLAVTRTYNLTNLMDDLKILCRVTGLEGKGVTFLMTDGDIKEESFLGLVNALLTSGDIPGLYPKDEVLAIISELRPLMQQEKPTIPDSPEQVWKFFVERVKSNLHIVLCFSPVNSAFRTRSLKFPALFSVCNLIWLSAWPKQALEAVASTYLRELPILADSIPVATVAHHAAHIHDVVVECSQLYHQQYRRKTHVTPKMFITFLQSYLAVYGRKHAELRQAADRMSSGLRKLLSVKEVEISKASRRADLVLNDVTQKTAAAESVKDSVMQVKKVAEEIANGIRADKQIAEEQLLAAGPALEEATMALNSIQPAHISTIKKLAKPPHLIMRIMDCVLILQGKRIDPVTQDPERPCPKPSWGESLKIMSQADFLSSLLNFAKDEMNEETIELIQPYLDMPDFSLEGAKKVSSDVAGLATWVKAMSYYYWINKKVVPLKANLAVQEHRLAQASADLNKAQQTLDEKQAEVDMLNAKYMEAISSKQTLQQEADVCKTKMNTASLLISGLSGEQSRWIQEHKALEDAITKLAGDALLAASFLVYSGPYNQAFRAKVLERWQNDLSASGIPCSPAKPFPVLDFLVNKSTISQWTLEGLPTDDLSLQNGALVSYGPKFPFIIDPQGQAKRWMLKHLPAARWTTTVAKTFRLDVEAALAANTPLIIEDCTDDIDSSLNDILDRNLIKVGRGFVVNFCDKQLEWPQGGATVVLLTKLPNPQLPPESFARCLVVDFAVTTKGLEEQLLGRVILHERQELETERTKLLEEISRNKQMLKDLEDNLLERLSSTQGSLVDDSSLVDVLAKSKTASEDVQEKLKTAVQTQVKITEAREDYRPVATQGSILFSIIADMAGINPMYQVSLHQFMQLFDGSMDHSAASPVTTKRVAGILDDLTRSTHRYILRGLYERDKLLFTFLLAIKRDLAMGTVSFEEFYLLLRGGAALDINAVVKKPYTWIQDVTWLNLVALSKLPQFADLLGLVIKNEKSWRMWLERDSPESDAFPGSALAALTPFQKFVLVRSFSPDRTIAAAKQYVESSMGSHYITSQVLELEALLGESRPETPLIGLLSPGADPSSDIEALSKRMRMEIKAISMGQGQEIHARRILSAMMQSGGWVLLQNCHLGIQFMQEIGPLLATASPVNENFRLWITTEANPAFPADLLHRSLKFTCEAPQGLRAGLQRTFQTLTQDALDISPRPQYKPTLCSVAFLHSIIQERRKFGPLGWAIPYEFNQADLAASILFVQTHFDELPPKGTVDWATIRYMICEVFYGGRVTDDYDRRLLNTYGTKLFGDFTMATSYAVAPGYQISSSAEEILTFRKNIEAMPLLDSTEVFGLHSNADMAFSLKESNDLLGKVLEIQPKDNVGSSGKTREEAVLDILNDLVSKLPNDFQPAAVKTGLQKQGATKPLTIFLSQEISRLQAVLSLVRSSLKDLKLAIEGVIVLSTPIQQVLDALFDAKTPPSWLRVSWESAGLGSWFMELTQRTAQLQAWLQDGRPACYNIGLFFNPVGFLTGVKQEMTRQHDGWALDLVKLTTEVTKQMKEEITGPPPEGVYVCGLQLEGAGFDKRSGRLCESLPKVIHTALPVVLVGCTVSTAEPDPKVYRCPVYKRPRRTDQNFVMEVELRTSMPPDHWVERGVALLAAV